MVKITIVIWVFCLFVLIIPINWSVPSTDKSFHQWISFWATAFSRCCLNTATWDPWGPLAPADSPDGKNHGFPHDASQMHACGSWIWLTEAGSHCIHEVSHRPLTRGPGTHSNPIFPFPCGASSCWGHKHSPATAVWQQHLSAQPRTTKTIRSMFLFPTFSLAPLAVRKTKLNIVRVSSPSQLYKHWEIPAVFYSVPQDRSTEHINPGLTKSVDAHKAASLLTNWDKPEALRQPQVCASNWRPPIDFLLQHCSALCPLTGRAADKTQHTFPLGELLSSCCQSLAPSFSSPGLADTVHHEAMSPGCHQKRPKLVFKWLPWGFGICHLCKRRISLSQHRPPSAHTAVMDGLDYRASSWRGKHCLGQKPLRAAARGPSNLIPQGPSPGEGTEVVWVQPSL